MTIMQNDCGALAGTVGQIEGISDRNGLDVRSSPLTGREWIALSKYVGMRDPHDHKPGEPQIRPELLRRVECFHVPIAQWADRILAENAIQPCLSPEDDTEHAEGVG
jgi:hypothetical protein